MKSKSTTDVRQPLQTPLVTSGVVGEVVAENPQQFVAQTVEGQRDLVEGQRPKVLTRSSSVERREGVDGSGELRIRTRATGRGSGVRSKALDPIEVAKLTQAEKPALRVAVSIVNGSKSVIEGKPHKQSGH